MSDRTDKEIVSELRRIRVALQRISEALVNMSCADVDEPIDPDDDDVTEDDLPFE